MALELPKSALLRRALGPLYRSDHAPFWAAGYPAVMLTDTAEFRNRHYHAPTDAIDTVDFAFAASVTVAVAHAIDELASRR